MSLSDWRLPDEWWERIAPVLPPGKEHPLGCHRSRIDDRRVMDAVLLALRSGSGWNAFSGAGLCSSSTAYRRYREWQTAGVFRKLLAMGLGEVPELAGVDWQNLESVRKRGRARSRSSRE